MVVMMMLVVVVVMMVATDRWPSSRLLRLLRLRREIVGVDVSSLRMRQQTGWHRTLLELVHKVTNRLTSLWTNRRAVSKALHLDSGRHSLEIIIGQIQVVLHPFEGEVRMLVACHITRGQARVPERRRALDNVKDKEHRATLKRPVKGALVDFCWPKNSVSNACLDMFFVNVGNEVVIARRSCNGDWRRRDRVAGRTSVLDKWIRIRIRSSPTSLVVLWRRQAASFWFVVTAVEPHRNAPVHCDGLVPRKNVACGLGIAELHKATPFALRLRRVPVLDCVAFNHIVKCFKEFPHKLRSGSWGEVLHNDVLWCDVHRRAFASGRIDREGVVVGVGQ